MNKLYFATQINNTSVIKNSSSGGLFYALSKYVLDNNGVVYGASFTDDFKDVIINRCNDITNIDKLLKSKYMMSSAKESFSQVKEDLDNGLLVLYSSLPCQMHALKNFLKKDYDNLICVEIVCHGALSSNIWRDYLEYINPTNKNIVSINMRDKRLGWYDYGMSIKYDDGSEFFENHKTNKYMKVFLCDKYLNNSCYNCKFKNDYSVADITIGDFWGLVTTKLTLDKKLGTNLVVINTEKGLKIFNTLNNITKYSITKEMAKTYNAGMSNTINVKPVKYNKHVFHRDNNIGILTLNFNDNIGGVLQAFALQKFLSNTNYTSTILQSHDYWHSLSFVKKLKCKTVQDFSKLKNEFDSYIVGSDQVWRREFISGKWKESWKSWEPLFLKFARNWNVNKIAYSASYGTDVFNFKDVIDDVKRCLDDFDAISLREIDATNQIASMTSTPTINTCDPTLLLDVSEYKEICKDIPKKEHGLFTYILDRSDEKTKIENSILKELKIKKIASKNSVEDWLASFRDCKCVLTDSYHGVLFSIIFNKPFICVFNKGRGGSRFNTLIELFNIDSRVITNINEIDYSLLKESPNIDYKDFVELSKEYLLSNLDKKKERKIDASMGKVSPVFGIISWLPDSEVERNQRITRLNKMIDQLIDIFGSDIKLMVIAQNWKDYTLRGGLNVEVFKYNKLGILGARKTLGRHFLESNYDYLIMCDDDIVLETDDSFSKEYLINELNANPKGFVFLQYGWSLTFCAVSKTIYRQSPMVDIDPEKGEGYEDTVWPYLLHYKYPDAEFKLSGIKFVQHKQAYHVNHKSTWNNNSVDHKKLSQLSSYHINNFKNGNFIIDKRAAEKYVDKQNFYERALMMGWINKEDIGKTC